MASETSRHLAQSHGDLDWLAFQYAAGELHGAELDAFEGLLATDLAAGEALARSVSLCQVVLVAEQQIATVSTVHSQTELPASKSGCSDRVSPTNVVVAASRQGVQHWVSKRVVALVGSAVCLAWMANWMAPGRQDLRTVSSQEHTATVAALWIQGADLATDSTADADDTINDDSDASMLKRDAVVLNNHGASGDLDASEGEADDDEGDGIPAWLLAAVAEERQGMGDPDEVMQD